MGLHPTWHKIVHSVDVSPSQSIGLMEKLNLTQQKHAFTNQKKCTTTQNKHKRLKPRWVTFYDIRPGNAAGLFSKEKISNVADKQGKGEEKRTSEGPYDIHNQTNIYIALRYKKLSYRQVTARCVLSVVILPITTQQCRNYLYDKSWPNRWYEVGGLVGGNVS